MSLELNVIRIDKGSVNERTLIPFLEIDADFKENEEYFREDTIELGFKNEAERVAKAQYENSLKLQKEVEGVEELDLLEDMLNELFSGNIEGFLFGSSICPGDSFEYKITETDFEYIVSFAYSIED